MTKRLHFHRPGGFIIQYHCYLFGFLYCSCGSKAKKAEVVAIPSSSAPHVVRTLQNDPTIFGDPTHGSYFTELHKGVVHVINLFSFL